MATLQMIKPSNTAFQINWKTIFPDFTTLTGSCNFIKKLMAVSVSALMYLRGIFPDKAYGERKLCGIKLKLLTEESGIKAVDNFIDFIRNCYDGIDNKYLDQVNIGICTDPENREDVLEAYSINFRYREDEYILSHQTTTMKLEEKDATVQATLGLLKGICCITDILQPLPKDAYLTMKLLFNDTTPSDYLPPGFELSSNEKFFFPSNAVKLELGKIATDFNQYRMFLKTALSKESLSQMYQESVMTSSQQSKKDAETKKENYGILPQNKALQRSDSFVVSKQQNEGKVQCLCGCKEDSGTKVLQCGVCGKKQHSICYGILNHQDISKFYCTDCIHNASSNDLKEEEIYGLDEFDQNKLSAFRRALVYCASLKQVTAYQLEKALKCNKPLAKDLIMKLEVEDFVTKSGPKYIVNEKKIIQQGYWMYFRRTENKENVEKGKPSVEKVSGGADFENERCKKKSNVTRNEEIVLEDDSMDFTIEDEVKRLTVSGVEVKRGNKLSRRRSFTQTKEDDSEEEYQQKSKKRKCADRNEMISLKEKDFM